MKLDTVLYLLYYKLLIICNMCVLMWGALVHEMRQCQYLHCVTVTAYKRFKGQVLGSEKLDDLLTGLRSNGLLKYSYILTGNC